MTYDEMKRRVERLEVLRSQLEELDRIQNRPCNVVGLEYTDTNLYLRPGWLFPDRDGFTRLVGAIKGVAQDISEEIKVEIAKLEED